MERKVRRVDDIPLADQIDPSDVEDTVREQQQYKLFEEGLATLTEGCQKLIRLSLIKKNMKEVAAELDLQYGYARKRKSECWARLLTWIRNAPGYADLKDR